MTSTTQHSVEIARQRRALAFLLVSLVAIFAWSAVGAHDSFTWIMEVWPAAVGVALLAATYNHFRFTTFVYGLIWMHAVILLIGGHYTYAQVPLFNWVRDHFHQARNNYDRVGHFAQGFVPAVIAREIFLRRRIVKRAWIPFVVVACCLAISALYELLEWQTAVWSGSAATDFLGTQGDPWDTQEDMATALAGAISAVALFSRLHDRLIERTEPGAMEQRTPRAPAR
jgi:putative membrane protein